MGNAEGKAAEELSQEKKKLLILDMLRKFKIS